MGVQSYWGGQAIVIVLSAVIGPKYARMKNTLPESAHVTTVSLVSFFIFLAIYGEHPRKRWLRLKGCRLIPMIAPLLLVPPEKLQLFLRVCLGIPSTFRILSS